MDIQLKRGFLEVCVLASLRQDDSYGYQIIKDIEPYISISESTLYPILKRLEQTSMVSTYSKEHNGRLRKYYHLNAKGIERIEEFRKEWIELMKVYNFIEESSKERGDGNE